MNTQSPIRPCLRAHQGFRLLLSTILLASAALTAAFAQDDPIQNLNQTLRKGTNTIFGFTFEERTRWEEKTA